MLQTVLSTVLVTESSVVTTLYDWFLYTSLVTESSSCEYSAILLRRFHSRVAQTLCHDNTSLSRLRSRKKYFRRRLKYLKLYYHQASGGSKSRTWLSTQPLIYSQAPYRSVNPPKILTRQTSQLPQYQPQDIYVLLPF